MSLFWVLAALMGLVAVLFLLWPLLRRSATLGEREASIAVLRDQLRELERDQEAARIGPEEARAARVEIERRALAADKLASHSAEQSGWRASLIVGAAAIAPALALVLYFDLGSPQLVARSAPNQTQADGAGAVPGDVTERTNALAARLEAEGGSYEEWTLLSQSLMMMNQPARAAEALAQAAELNDGPAIKAAWAEMLIQANGGRVTPEAEGLLGEVLQADPSDPRARYYKGVAAAQAQFFDDALEIWGDLLDDTPSDAPWRNAVIQGIRDVAEASGQDPAPLLAGQAVRGDGVDLDQLRARLEAEPKDYEGWLALAEGEVAAGNPAAAQAAIARVREEFPAAPFVQQQINQAEQALGLDANVARGPTAEDVQAAQEMSANEQLEMIRGMVGGLAERLEDNPDDPDGWMMLMRSYGVLGDREAGQAAYEQALEHFASDQAFLAQLEQQARLAGIIQ